MPGQATVVRRPTYIQFDRPATPRGPGSLLVSAGQHAGRAPTACGAAPISAIAAREPMREIKRMAPPAEPRGVREGKTAMARRSGLSRRDFLRVAAGAG